MLEFKDKHNEFNADCKLLSTRKVHRSVESGRKNKP